MSTSNFPPTSSADQSLGMAENARSSSHPELLDAVSIGSQLLSALPAQQPVLTVTGPQQVRDLAHLDRFAALSHDGRGGRYRVTWMKAFRIGRGETFEILTDKGTFHLFGGVKIRLAHYPELPLSHVLTGMRLFACVVDAPGGYVRVALRNGQKERRHLHRLIVHDLVAPLEDGQVVHHLDGNSLNNDPNNLKVLDSQGTHANLHNERLVQAGEHIFQKQRFPKYGATNPMHRSSDFWQDEKRAKRYREKQRQKMTERDPVQMQAAATRQRYLNQGWQLLNEGHDIGTLEGFLRAYEKSIRRVDSKPRRRAAMLEVFGSWENYLAELSAKNHRVISIRRGPICDAYAVTEIGTLPSGKETVVLASIEQSGMEGSGLLVRLR
jgi:hypothetical protein